MAIFRRKRAVDDEPGIIKRRESSEDTLADSRFYNRPTTLRIFTVCLYLVALAFLILVELGNINGKAVIRSTYFLKINLANVVPESVPNAVLINTIAQSIGLHDFYQVGLWSYCEGYNSQGITGCSNPKDDYWFNPVEIILSQLLAGASIALPTEVVNILHIVRTASHWMFACFLTGACLTFVCIFIAPMGFSKKPRWSHKTKRIFCRQFPVTILTFLALLFTAGGAVIATVMFAIFRNTFKSATALNIEAELGSVMLGFEWTAVALLLVGFIMQFGTCFGVCCCTGKRKAIRNSKIQPVVQEK